MKTALFIDGSNTFATAKALNLDIDYGRVRSYFGDDLFRAYYYTALLDDKEEYVSIKPLVDWLSYNKYSVVTKPTKTFIDPLTGLTKLKGNMDVEIAVQAMAMIPYIEKMVLFSGDGDFKSLVLEMQSKGIICHVVSSIKTQPSMCADELRRAADEFHDLANPDLYQAFTRGREEPRRGSRFA